jgi:hypothetical protein
MFDKDIVYDKTVNFATGEILWSKVP